MISTRLRYLALSFVPIAILGLSPRLTIISGIISTAYVGLALMTVRDTRCFATRGWLYVATAAIYLAISLATVPDLSAYGLAKSVFLIGFVFPFGMAVSMLVRDRQDIRPILMGFVILGSALSFLAVTQVSRSVLGAERYQWLGNLSAISVLIILQFWFIKAKPLAILLLLINLGGVATAAAKQSVALVAVGSLAIVLVRVIGSNRKKGDIAILLSLLLGTALAWGYIRQLPIMTDLLARLALLRSPTGGFTLLQRQLLFSKAWQCFIHNPVSGIGIGEFVNYPGWTGETIGELHIYPHNTMLEILCEQGLLGFSVLIVPLFAAAYRMLRRALTADGNPEFGALILFLAGVVMADLTGDLSTRPLWIFGILLFRLNSLGRIEHRLGSAPATPSLRLPQGA